jgi:hypothetical protein
MGTRHLNASVSLIEALLQCAKGEEWLLLQQHQDLIDAELLTVMAQVTERLNTEGNAPAAQFLRYWALQLNHMLAQNPAQAPAEDRWRSLSAQADAFAEAKASPTRTERESQSYLQLIQTLLGCAKGDEAAILSQHPELLDEGLVYTMKQVAAQLAAQGSQDIAIYLKHLAAEIHHGWLQPNERRGRSPISSPPSDIASIDPELATVSSLQPPNGNSDVSIDPSVTTASKLHPDEGRFVAADPTPKSSPPLHSQIDPPIDPGVATVTNRYPNEARTEVATPIPRSAPPSNNQIEELLANISSRLEQMERSIDKRSTPSNPLWYMPILEQAATQGWIISSEEVEQLIGIKPHCDSGHNFFMRGCWKFVKAGKVGTHSSWRVLKEIVTLPSVGIGVASATAEANRIPEPEPQETNLEPELASPWTESN